MLPYAQKHFHVLKKSTVYFFFIALLFLPQLLLQRASGAEEQLVITEVTVGQYAAFLKSTSAADGPQLYEEKMAFQQGALFRRGLPGNYSYDLPFGAENELVHFVSRDDQMRFCNWIENGRPAGFLGTEHGTYELMDHSCIKNPEASCSLLDQETDLFLKSSEMTFSIVGPASLLQTANATLLDPHTYACAGPEVVTTLAEEIETFLLGMGLLGAGEGIRRSPEEGSRTLHSTDELASSSTLSHQASLSSLHDQEETCELSDVTARTLESPLAQRLQETEKAHQEAEQYYHYISNQSHLAGILWNDLSIGVPQQVAGTLHDLNNQIALCNHLFQQTQAAHFDWMNTFQQAEATSFNYCNSISDTNYVRCIDSEPKEIQALEEIQHNHFLEWHELCALRDEKFSIFNQLYQQRHFADLKLHRLQAFYEAANTRYNDPNRELHLEFVSNSHIQMEALLEEAQQTLTDLSKELEDDRKVVALKEHIIAIIDSAREKWEPLKNKMTLEKIKSFSADCVTAAFHWNADQSQESLQAALLKIIDASTEQTPAEPAVATEDTHPLVEQSTQREQASAQENISSLHEEEPLQADFYQKNNEALDQLLELWETDVEREEGMEKLRQQLSEYERIDSSPEGMSQRFLEIVKELEQEALTKETLPKNKARKKKPKKKKQEEQKTAPPHLEEANSLEQEAAPHLQNPEERSLQCYEEVEDFIETLAIKYHDNMEKYANAVAQLSDQKYQQELQKESERAEEIKKREEEAEHAYEKLLKELEEEKKAAELTKKKTTSQSSTTGKKKKK